jgi:hypothetical protein
MMRGSESSGAKSPDPLKEKSRFLASLGMTMQDLVPGTFGDALS